MKRLKDTIGTPPILVSPHNPQTIYFIIQRLWKSENRGDSWTPISNDLTNNIPRIRTNFLKLNKNGIIHGICMLMSNYMLLLLQSLNLQ